MFILLESTLNYDSLLTGIPEHVKMVGKNPRGKLGWLLVVHLGRRFLMNN
jgi:hypothetical protein